MNSFQLMVEEHEHIKRMLVVIRKYCYRILNGNTIVYEDFYRIIDFVRNYADKHHHGKEETLLFEKMMEELGPTAEKLVKYGMNVEHDLGRLHMQELEAAVSRVINGEEESRLDVIANAISYTHLLYRHIDKEDNVVYVYAQRNLSQAALEGLDKACERFERDTGSVSVNMKYLSLIEEFEKKVDSME